MKIFSVLFGLIIGIVFAVAGILIALETAIPTYQSWQTMKNWQPATATLLTIAGATNNTEATYRYTVAGDEYQNNRVYLASFKDNIGSYHQEMYQHLQWLKTNYQPVNIWYDPNNPNHSVIDREMRWGLFSLMAGFCAVFILIGLVVSYSCIKPRSQQTTNSRKPSLFELRREWKKKQENSNYQESFIDFSQQRFLQLTEQATKEQTAVEKNISKQLGSQPWLNKKEWQSPHIRSGAKKSMYALWAFAIVWSAISTPIIFVLEEEIKQENYAALLGLLFPMVGLFLLNKAWQTTKEWQRFGVIELEMDPFPGSIGGHVGGNILVKNSYDFNTQYKIELECVYSYVSGSGENRSRRESIKWAEGGSAKIETAVNGIRLKFLFDVPDNLPESNVEQEGNYYFWRLTINADLAGIDLNRQYNIPVFNTQTQSKYIRHNISAQAEAIRENKALESQAAIDRGDFAKTSLARALRYKDKGSQQIFYFPMFRNKILSIFALVFAAGFNFAAYSINDSFADGGIMSIGMLIFSIPFALVGLIATVAVIYLPLNNLTTTLAQRKIKALRRLFIFPIKYDVIQTQDIKKMEIKSTGSTGQGVKQIKHYKVIAHTKNDKKVTIAEDIDGEDLANQLKGFICKRLLITC